MTQEEKAKAYDKAIEYAKDLLQHTDENYVCKDYHKKDMEYLFRNLFPELKESEDERIKGKIIDILKKSPGCCWYGQKEKDDCIAYLEKQKEQKTTEWNIHNAKKGDILAYGSIVLIVDEISSFEGRPIIKSWYFCDSKQFYGQGTSVPDRFVAYGFRPATEAEILYLAKMAEIAGYRLDIEKREIIPIEQKPVEWSEEDKDMIDKVISSLQGYCCTFGSDPQDHKAYVEKEIDWLKSLRPQPHKELSIEKAIQWFDDTFYSWDQSSSRGRYCEIITNDFDSMEEMYDSFRKAVTGYSQPHWKPSKKQMKALKYVAYHLMPDENYREEMFSLYEELEKLM